MHTTPSRLRVGPPLQWQSLLVLLSVAALVVPSYWMLSQNVWRTDEQGHGPIILAVTLWLAWSRREEFLRLPDAPADVAGGLSLLVGLGMYVIGRSQSVDTIEVLAHIPILAAVLLLTKGTRGLRWGLFYLVFLLFIVPLPGLLVQAITAPLKSAVSHVAEALLHAMNYPIGRSGVILFIGPYQLLVADACAGLNSIFTIEALGLLYLNIMRYTSFKRNLALCLTIVPIAFIANVVRVLVLVLVTYYFGDEAGQGFVHGFAGIVLFIVALTLTLSVDMVFGRLFFDDRRQAARGEAAR